MTAMTVTPVPRSAHTAAAAASVLGIAALAACGGTSAPPATDRSYADGTYTAEGTYATPETVETVSVTVTLADDVITAVEVVGDPKRRESEEHQALFIGGIADAVVGRDIDEARVSRVAGSSLTSGGFNEALELIKADAAE